MVRGEFLSTLQRMVEEMMKEQEKEEPAKKRRKQQVVESSNESPLEQDMRVIKEDMQVMKKDMQDIKHLLLTFVTSSTQSAPADRNVNPRTSPDHQITTSEEGELRLLFVNKLPDIIFTKANIKDENGEFVEIQLIAIIRGQMVKKGHHFPIEVEIHVLEDDSDSKGHENGNKKDFNDKIAKPRKNNEPLVKGTQCITLMNGVGIIKDLSFLVNSSWTNSKKFRLGARVSQSSSDMGIKEAISGPFAVRDYRSIRNKKNYVPSLDDKVWHLKKITKGGKFHIRLMDKDIHTIRDFKKIYRNNPIELREILKDCSEVDWEEIELHASAIVDDDNSNPIRSQEADANNTATTDPPFPGFQYSLTQGSTRMQNDSNRASSSQYPQENSQYLTPPQPQTMFPSHFSDQLNAFVETSFSADGNAFADSLISPDYN